MPRLNNVHGSVYTSCRLTISVNMQGILMSLSNRNEPSSKPQSKAVSHCQVRRNRSVKRSSEIKQPLLTSNRVVISENPQACASPPGARSYPPVRDKPKSRPERLSQPTKLQKLRGGGGVVRRTAFTSWLFVMHVIIHTPFGWRQGE